MAQAGVCLHGGGRLWFDGHAKTRGIEPAAVAGLAWLAVDRVFGCAGGSGWVSAEFALAGRSTVLAATCVGNDTLVIAPSSGQSGTLAGPARAFVLPCGRTNPAAGRVAITDLMPVPDVVTVSAGVVEDPGTLRHATFELSVEQPAP
jgi:hypothetical protein